MKNQLFLFAFLVMATGCQNSSSPDGAAADQSPAESSGQSTLTAQKVAEAPAIDGYSTDACWQKAPWHPIGQRWIGPPYTSDDFSGRYKLAWDENFIYLLAEIVDDTLIDLQPDGLKFYWDDDCLEVFIDEDHSGGDHQYNYNAFAYHIALDNRVVDIGPDSLAHYYDQHLTSRRTQDGKVSTWEVALSLYDDTYQDGRDNEPVLLSAGKKVGFALAYCDNDHSPEREHFIGSVAVPGEDKNRGWIDAGIFGALLLTE